MPIKEKSFRIGCGRYLQEKGILNSLGEEVLRLGSSPIIVGGKTALSLTRETIENSVKKSCNNYCIEEYLGTCNDEYAQQLAQKAKELNLDVIVGVGGGVIMDFAKLVAYFASLPLINVPTSSATCAAYTPLSVRYTPEGKTVGSRHYEYEVDAVICDSEILAKQPPRLLLAGVFDALAKFVEIKHRFNESTTEFPIGLNWAYHLSKATYADLCAKTEPALIDMANGLVSDNVEQTIFTSIATTGVISGIARGSNQTALGHKFYETTRVLFHEEAKPYLHGEIVGVGLIFQNAFNGEKPNNDDLIALMKKYDMPCSLSSIGVKPTKEALELYYEKLVNSSAIEKDNASECENLRASLEYLWQLN